MKIVLSSGICIGISLAFSSTNCVPVAKHRCIMEKYGNYRRTNCSQFSFRCDFTERNCAFVL